LRDVALPDFNAVSDRVVSQGASLTIVFRADEEVEFFFFCWNPILSLSSVFRQGVLSNRWMVGAMLASATLLFAAVYLPPLQPWFNTATPDLAEWTYIVPLVLLPFLMTEAAKVLLKRWGR
jgi:Ca2+-transporting ATPase